ncbi:Hypothetical protein NTJ_02867 [Nesidiocoris tenuis]|uniref:Uncharacterized protein n=1 Tax=Nesidiocoris tenuis TaxID=355587 RepID=A0ABN7AFW4_9HEMI|nr:Hypothetical protein NTJ_02867 [Nesidiocoris tenuis]
MAPDTNVTETEREREKSRTATPALPLRSSRFPSDPLPSARPISVGISKGVKRMRSTDSFRPTVPPPHPITVQGVTPSPSLAMSHTHTQTYSQRHLTVRSLKSTPLLTFAVFFITSTLFPTPPTPAPYVHP